jgi:hypothetical protein
MANHQTRQAASAESAVQIQAEAVSHAIQASPMPSDFLRMQNMAVLPRMSPAV